MKIRILLKVLFIEFFDCFPKLISDEKHSKLLFWIIFGYFPNFEHPKTMNEYICATKIEDSKLGYYKYTDKYMVRDYVAQVVGDKYLNEVLGVYSCFDEIDFNMLPKSFVLKATHGSSYNIIVKDKSLLDKRVAKRKFDKWLRENYYYKDREKNYKNIKPRIMCDVYLEPSDEELEEYKLFCFNGKVGFIQHNKMLNGERHSNIFDSNWELLPVRYGYSGFIDDKRPDNGEELINVAESLAEPFEFVRVDLYNVDGRIIFSELTFHSGGGLIPFKPKEYDFRFGQLLKDTNMS